MKRRFQIWQRGTSKILGEFIFEADDDLGNINDFSKHYFSEQPLTDSDLASVKKEQKSRVNHIAGIVRERFISNGAGIDAVYLSKAQEAAQCLASGGTETDYPLLAAEATATGRTLAEAANYVVATSNAWKIKGSEIEVIRRTGEVAIAAATEQADVIAAADTAVASLEAIQ